MRKCEGIYSLIGKVNHKSAIYGFELLKEKIFIQDRCH